MMISTGVVSVRVWVKRKVQGGLASDDYFMIFGYLAAMGMSIANCLTISVYHWDRHIWDAVLDLPLVVDGRKAIWVLYLFNQFANIGIKLSILLLIKKMILRTNRRWLYWAIWFTMVFVTASNSIYVVLSWVECLPLNAWWNRMDLEWAATHDYKCWGESVITVSAGAFNLVQDFMVATLPVFVVFNLQIARTKKASIITLFGLGYL
jgi:hypothetical protein